MDKEERPAWYVNRGEAPHRFDFFISHVSEDNEAVIALKNEIVALSVEGGRPSLRCFLDLHDWAPAMENLGVIREGLFHSRHAILWVSPDYLKRSVRGWVWVELAYADLIEQSLIRDSIRDPRLRSYPFVTPIFQNVKVARVERTPLLDYWSRNLLAHGREYFRSRRSPGNW